MGCIKDQTLKSLSRIEFSCEVKLVFRTSAFLTAFIEKLSDITTHNVIGGFYLEAKCIYTLNKIKICSKTALSVFRKLYRIYIYYKIILYCFGHESHTYAAHHDYKHARY